MHWPLIPEVSEVVLHRIFNLSREGGVVVIGTRTDPTLVEHSVEGDFIHAFLKKRFR